METWEKIKTKMKLKSSIKLSLDKKSKGPNLNM